MENVANIIRRANEILNISVDSIDYEGETYIITSDTGEGVFAYLLADFVAGLDAAEQLDSDRYSLGFCGACDPVADEGLARAIYEAKGLQICEGGSCMRVVDFDEPECSCVDEEDDDPNDISNVDYEGYWNTVIGDRRTAESTVAEFDLAGGSRRDLDEWLGEAEMAAWTAGGNASEDFPTEQWGGHHAQAIAELWKVVAPTDEYTSQNVDPANYADRTDDDHDVEPDEAIRYVHGTDPNATVTVLWYANAQRACVITNGGDEWTDADDARDALVRYCTGTMAE